MFMKIKTIYRMTALIVLIVLLFSSGAGIVPARAENRRKVTKKLQEIMQDKEPDTPIDFVFIELKIDDDDYEKRRPQTGYLSVRSMVFLMNMTRIPHTRK